MSNNLPREIAAIFENAGVKLPLAKPIPLKLVDEALRGETIENRFLLKGAMRALLLIR